MSPACAVGVVCALAAEARHLGIAARHDAIATLPDGTLVLVSGMGGAAAAAAAQRLLDAGVAGLVSFGWAGGLDPTLAPGALFLPESVIAADGASSPAGSFRSDPAWRDRLAAALIAHRPLARGTLLTSRRAIARVADKSALHRVTGAVAVDMECLDLAAVAWRHQVPFIAVKVIIDGARDALPRAAVAATDERGQVHVGRLLGGLAAAPAQLLPLLRLARHYRAASRTLAAVGSAHALTPAPTSVRA